MNEIEDFMEENSVVYAVISNSETKSWNEYGSKADVAHQGIVNEYIPDSNSLQRLSNILEGRVQPLTVRQGIVTCIITQAKPGVVAVIFIHDNSDVISRRRRASKISSDLNSILSAV